MNFIKQFQYQNSTEFKYERKLKPLLQFTRFRQPGAAKQGVSLNPIEQRGTPTATKPPVADVYAHFDDLSQRPPPLGIFLLPPPNQSPLLHGGLDHRRRDSRRATAAWPEEEKQREEEGVNENERSPQSFENRNNPIARSGGQLVHLGPWHGGNGKFYRRKIGETETMKWISDNGLGMRISEIERGNNEPSTNGYK